MLMWCNSEGYEDKTYVIDNVFNPNKNHEADTNLVIVEKKPINNNFIDKLIGKYNNSKIKLYIDKNHKNYKLQIPSYNDYNFDGKGIVIAASGNRYRYVTGLYMNIYTIRKQFNSNIPVEIIYVGKKEEFNINIYNKLMELENVKIIDLTSRLDTNISEDKLRGYRTKPLAALASSFEEVILLDADSLMFIDPYYLFETNGYNNYGMILFKDYVDCLKFINKKFIEDIGIGADYYCNKTHGYEIDSSCVVINKEKAWEALFTICIINIESEAYYGHPLKKNNVLGDKDTWLIGSMFVDFEPHVVQTNPGIMVITKDKNCNSYNNNCSMELVLGHVQFQYTKDFQIFMNEGEDILPIYYNNQAIDLLEFDGMDNWGYIDNNIKNPNMFQSWNNDYKHLTSNMLNAFKTASKAVKDIINIIDPNPPNKSNRRHQMVVGNFL